MSVLNSRRVWTFLAAQIFSLIVLLVGHYVTDPFYSQVAVILIGTGEGLAAFVIGALTIDDIKGNQAHITADKEIQIRAIEAGMHPKYPGVFTPPSKPGR